MDATECVESDASTPGHTGDYGEVVPAAWEQTGLPVTFISDILLSCSRVSWGSLERPSFILWDLHESVDTPESCKEQGDLNRVVGGIWFSDEALFQRAKDFGMPAHLGVFNLSIQDVQGVQTWEWQWHTEGSDESSLTFHGNPPDLTVESTSPWRFFWFTDNGVSYYDYTAVQTWNQGGAPTATGTLAPPMLYANGGNPAFAGTAELRFKADYLGEIHQFSDYECKQPRSS